MRLIFKSHATFSLTVIFDLTVAIAVGLVLAIFAFLKRVNESTEISHSTGHLDLSDESEIQSTVKDDEYLQLPESVEVYEISGPFFFGVANKFDEKMRLSRIHHDIRIIRMRKVPFIDSTGLNNLEMLCRNSIKEKIQVILSGVNSEVREKIERSEIPHLIGEENICSNIHLAIERAKEIEASTKLKI